MITCEHAGNQVPDSYAYLFKDHEDVLQTHRGYDPGAWEIAQYISNQLNVPVFGCHTTRLLVEANRSLGSSELFSEFSKPLSEIDKQKILNQYYVPYRQAVVEALLQMNKPIIHISIHTFTPIWEGKERKVDIGLLFDQERKHEEVFCDKWKAGLDQLLPGLQVKFNEPYKGIHDGFTTYLRKKYPEDYIGIEVEINQKYFFLNDWETIAKALVKSISMNSYFK
jgi:predicted N-formylglutamate amidohydrolase